MVMSVTVRDLVSVIVIGDKHIYLLYLQTIYFQKNPLETVDATNSIYRNTIDKRLMLFRPPLHCTAAVHNQQLTIVKV